MAAVRGAIHKRYARALFEMGVEHGTFEAAGDELGALAAVYQDSAELRQTLRNPGFTMAEKRAILGAIFPRIGDGLLPTSPVGRFVLLLLDRGRIELLPRIAQAYRDLTDVQVGLVRATVVSARPLDAAAEDEVRRALERRMPGKRVLIDKEVDEGLMGGVVARVGGLVFDGSLRSRLADLQNRILN